MSSQGVDVTVKDLEADLKTMKIIVNENNEHNCELKPFPPDNLSLFSSSQAQRQPCHGNTDED